MSGCEELHADHFPGNPRPLRWLWSAWTAQPHPLKANARIWSCVLSNAAQVIYTYMHSYISITAGGMQELRMMQNKTIVPIDTDLRLIKLLGPTKRDESIVLWIESKLVAVALHCFRGIKLFYVHNSYGQDNWADGWWMLMSMGSRNRNRTLLSRFDQSIPTISILLLNPRSRSVYYCTYSRGYRDSTVDRAFTS